MHAAHVCAHPGTVGASTHRRRAQPAGWDVPVRPPAALAGHWVHGAAHPGSAGVVSIGHPCVARLPGVT